MHSPYYRPSGQVPRTAMPIGAGCGLAVVPAALLYAWVTMRAPAFVNVLALACFACYIAVVNDWAARQARVRNRAWMGRFGVALALCAWYGQWVAWIALAMQRQHGGALWHHAAALVADPPAMLAAVNHVAQHDAWGVGTMPMVAVWLVEAYVLVHFAAALGQARTGQPFCEASGTWAEKVAVPVDFACVADTAAAVRLLEQAPHRLPSVLAPLSGPAGAQHTAVTLYRCQGGDTYVSICNRLVRDGQEGKHHFIEQEWLTMLRVPGVEAGTLLAQLEARAEAAPAASRAEAPPVPPELSSALAMFQAAQFGDAFARALPHVQSAQRQVRCDANRLCGLARMRQGRWGQAIPWWQAVFADEATPANAMQLAGCYAMAGDLAAGQDWFDRARVLNGASRAVAPVSLLTNWVSALDMAGHPAATMPWLDEIRELYCARGVTDHTVLFANQMPSLSEFLERSAPIVLAALGRDPGLRWFAAMLGRLDEAGNVELGHWIDEQARSLAR